MKKLKSKLLLELFGIKPKNQPLIAVTSVRTIVPSHFPDGKPASEAVWDSDKFPNKTYL